MTAIVSNSVVIVCLAVYVLLIIIIVIVVNIITIIWHTKGKNVVESILLAISHCVQ